MDGPMVCAASGIPRISSSSSLTPFPSSLSPCPPSPRASSAHCKASLPPSTFLSPAPLGSTPHQASSLIQAPLQADPSSSRLSTFSHTSSNTQNLIPVQAVFQYISLPSIPWPLWTTPVSSGKATPANQPAPISSAVPNATSTSPSVTGSAASGSATVQTSRDKNLPGNSPRAVRAAASQAAAAAIIASELTHHSHIHEDHSSPDTSGSSSNRSNSTSWLVSFLVNYSLVMSAWWQFKHTAPAAVQHWIEENAALHVPPMHLPTLPKTLPLPLPHIHLPHVHVPVPLLASALALVPRLPFNPLLSFAFSPSSILKGLRAPWAPRELPSPDAPGSKEESESKEEGPNGNGSVRRVPVIVHSGETDEDERVESVVPDDMEPGVMWGQRHKDVEAERERGVDLAPLGFSYSAAGLLFPYHLGATQLLLERGILTDDVPLAGASAGAIVCATIAAGVDMATALESTKVLARDCRAKGTAFRLGGVLRGLLEELLPEDCHEMCSGRIRIAVTQVFGRPRGLLVDQFDSKEDLINALCTSSFIPGYLAPSPITRFRGRICVDGGLTLFIPPTASHNTVRVCAFPASSLGLSNVAISPDVSGIQRWSMRQLFEWALEPAADVDLDLMFEEGYKDASIWLDSTLGVEENTQQGLILPEKSLTL